MKAKCHNYSGCLKAYRGEAIELAEGTPLVCPECAKPMTVVTGGLPVFKIVLAGVGLAALIAALYLGKAGFTDKRPEELGTKPVPSIATGPSTPVVDVKKNTAEPPPVPEAGPETAAPIRAPANLDLDLGNAETKEIKASVLTRIDLMPDVTQANKDKLYASVERARRMGKVLTIPFLSGKTALTPVGIQSLKTALEVPVIIKLRDDPTAVFVILGYADLKGDKQKNIAISQTRADAVLSAMREKCGVVNVMHSVAMGGSALVDPENMEKNRIVEVWAVLP